MSHFVYVADCRCGLRMYILDGAISSLKKWGVQRAAKKMGRRFIDTRMTRSCPQCGEAFDLSKPDERYLAQHGELIRQE